MHHDFIDKYSRGESPVHRLPAGVKLAAALLTLTGVVLVPASCPWYFAAAGLLLCGVAAITRIPAGYLVTRLLLLEPLALGVALLALFQKGGLTAFLILVTRSSLCLFTIILLTSTTPFAEILRCMRRIRIPALLVTVLALMYRYIFVLIEETERMRRARSSRTFRASRRRSWKSLAAVAGQLFARSSERAERIYAAMCARGWKT